MFKKAAAVMATSAPGLALAQTATDPAAQLVEDVDFTNVLTAVGTLGLAIAALYIGLKGIEIVIRKIRSA